MPVVVEVTDRAADAIRLLSAGNAGHTRASGDIGERTVVVVPVQPIAEPFGPVSHGAARERRSLRKE